MEKQFVEVEDGEEVAAVHHEADSSKWIFLCHGFGGSKDRGNSRRAEFFNEKGWNAVRLDFRGNGESDGDFIDQGLSSRIDDLKAVHSFFDPERSVVFGTSFGAKVVLHSGLGDAIALKSPVTFNSVMDRFREAVENKGRFEYIDGKPIDQRFFADLDRYSFEDLQIERPVFISHGSMDQTVHPENSVKALQRFEADVILQRLQGEKHSYSEEAGEKLRKAMLDWAQVISEPR
ncbi:MAG: alpha/beta hydrolase family protein [Candidatus Nanohaloarchaea archaeon]